MKFNDIWVRAGMRTNFDRVHSRQGLPKKFCRDRGSHPPHVWRGKLHPDSYFQREPESLYCGGLRFDMT